MAVFGKLSNVTQAADTPPTDDGPSTPSPSGEKPAKKAPVTSEAKTTQTEPYTSTGLGLGTTSLLGSKKDDVLFSVANSPTRKRDFDINEFNL